MRYALRAPKVKHDRRLIHAAVHPAQFSRDEWHSLCGMKANTWEYPRGETEVTCERCLRHLDTIRRLGT